MEPNLNPPSEREWTSKEKEEFFANLPKQPPIQWSTGAWNGPLIELDPEDPFGDMERIFNRGIHVTSITPPESGWPVAFYCPLCKVTTFVLSPWAVKPSDGDFWRMEMCGSDVEGFRHNMQLGMKGLHDPIELKPSNLWWAKEEKP